MPSLGTCQHGFRINDGERCIECRKMINAFRSEPTTTIIPLTPAAAVERVKELDAKATPGPWERTDEGLRGGLYWVVAPPGIDDTIDLHESDNGEANTAFIAESRTLLPVLAAEIERQAGAAALLRDTLSAAGAKFREYERMHLDKGTEEGARKAQANARMAQMCEAALKSGKEGA